jgi:hypothetical protein
MDETYILKSCEDLRLALELELDRMDFSKWKYKNQNHTRKLHKLKRTKI